MLITAHGLLELVAPCCVVQVQEDGCRRLFVADDASQTSWQYSVVLTTCDAFISSELLLDGGKDLIFEDIFVQTGSV